MRTVLRDRLCYGLKTQVVPRAETSEQINELIARLQTLDKKDYTGKLVYAGFTLSPYIPSDDEEDEQACDTCRYYRVHRRFCGLPELMLPVEGKWACRLWRI